MNSQELYSFVFRGLLAEEALDKTSRISKYGKSEALDKEIAKKCSLELLSDDFAIPARRMATVYTVIAAFENSVRDLVTKKLLEVGGANWWQDCVPEGIRTRAESRKSEEEKILWHSARGQALINYVEFGNLLGIIKCNWAHFEDLLQSQEWVHYIFETLERSRNVIMHSGKLSLSDVERIGSVVRDWVKQTGG